MGYISLSVFEALDHLIKTFTNYCIVILALPIFNIFLSPSPNTGKFPFTVSCKSRGY
jgi:hypothetical protein